MWVLTNKWMLQSHLVCVTAMFSLHPLSISTESFNSPPHPNDSFPDVLKQHQVTQFTPERFIKVHLWRDWLSKAEIVPWQLSSQIISLNTVSNLTLPKAHWRRFSENDMLNAPKVKKKLKKLNNGCRNIIVSYRSNCIQSFPTYRHRMQA